MWKLNIRTQKSSKHENQTLTHKVMLFSQPNYKVAPIFSQNKHGGFVTGIPSS
jgi:hypothetical protein